MQKKPVFRRFLFPAAVFLVLLVLFFFLKIYPSSSHAENRRFEKVTELLFREEVSSSTINLHYLLSDPSAFGIPDSEVSLGSVFLPDADKVSAACENTRHLLSSFDPEKLSLQNRRTLDVLLFDLESEEMPGSASPLAEVLGPSLGIQAQLPVLLSEYTFRTRKDVLDYLKLLKDFPSCFQQIITVEQEKSRLGYFMNDACAKGILEQCSSFLTDPEENFLQTSFAENLKKSKLFSEKEQAICLSTHQKLLQSCVYPAYHSLMDALTELLGTGTNPGGLCRFDGGKDYYQYLVRSRVGTDLTTEELYQKLTKKILTDCAEVQTILSSEPTLALSLHGDSVRLTFSSPEEMLEDLQAAMQEDFPALSAVTYEVKEVDDSLSDFSSPAFYLTPPVDTCSPNSIYLNTKRESKGLELYETLAHEGFPGHLYQTVSFSRTDAPLIRHLHMPSGYVEGWATYVESYASSYAARNSTDDEKAVCRLWYLNRSIQLSLCSLLDLGIHDRGWLPEDASSFLAKFGISDPETVQELYQYIVETPANYLKYSVGSLSFLDLKDTAMEKEKETFSLPEFHKKLLEIGPMPFPLVKKYLFPS